MHRAYRKTHGGFSAVLLMGAAAVAVVSFFVGRYSGSSSLTEENQKLRESVRLLRGDKLGGGKAETPPAPPVVPQPPCPAPAAAAPVPAAPPVAAVVPSPTPPPAAETPAPAPTPPPPPAASATDPELPPPIAMPRPRKTARAWVADWGNGIQGTATYWHCNNATLVEQGMEYYAYGSIPAERLKQAGDAYSVREGRAILISGCWSPRHDKAILYRKSDGHRWEPDIKLDDGSWTLEAN